MGWFSNVRNTTRIKNEIKKLEKELEHHKAKSKEASMKGLEYKLKHNQPRADYWYDIANYHIDKEYYTREEIRNLEKELY